MTHFHALSRFGWRRSMAGMGQILSFDRGAGEEGSDLASKSEINLINNQKKP